MEVNGFLIRPARGADQAALKQIWRICFGDPDKYINLFFDSLYPSDSTYVAVDAMDRPIAMAMGLDLMALKIPGVPLSRPCRYLYAVATLPSHRGRGLGAGVSQAVGADIVLPAEDNLYSYYGNLGFRNFFYVKEWKLEAGHFRDGVSAALLCPCSIEEYSLRREKQLVSRTHLVLDPKLLRYQQRLGGLFSICSGCAAVEADPASDFVMVKELLVPESEMRIALQSIAAYFPGKTLSIRCPANGSEACRSFGQLFVAVGRDFPSFNGPAPYFGLALD